MQSYPKIKLKFDRRKTATQNTSGTIEIEILYGGKRKWISTGIRILPSEWSKKDEIIYNRLDALNLNLEIESKIKALNGFIQSLIIRNKEFKWDELELFINNDLKQESFIDYIENKIKTKTNLVYNTIKGHKKLINSLKDFNLIKDFNDIILKNIREYDIWLHQKGYKQTTISSYHKYLKLYINDAIRDEKIEANPYSFFKVDRGKPAIRKYLTKEQIDLITNAKLAVPALEKIRDLFLFQCYTGIAYADLDKFDFTKVIHSNGKYTIHDVRQKTGEDYYIVLLSNAIDILKKYNYVLPKITNQQYNMRLKIIAEDAGLNVNLTSHMARHTYASLCINAGIKIEVLAKMLGHSDIKTTQLYAKMLNKTVEAAFETLDEKLTKGEKKNIKKVLSTSEEVSFLNNWNVELIYPTSF